MIAKKQLWFYEKLTPLLPLSGFLMNAKYPYTNLSLVMPTPTIPKALNSKPETHQKPSNPKPLVTPQNPKPQARNPQIPGNSKPLSSKPEEFRGLGV